MEKRPAFSAFERRRRLVPADNFCEWKKTWSDRRNAWCAFDR
jgi:putative SOS response-associated peptidase YedK